MKQYKTQIDSHGKVLIPAKIRKEMNLKAGDNLVLRRMGNEVVLVNLKDVVRKIQNEIASKGKKHSVDAFIANKRKEAQKENEDFE